MVNGHAVDAQDEPPAHLQEEAAAATASPAGDEPEESVYAVMKQHMARQKQEQEARNAQLKQQRTAAYGRPQAVAPSPAPEAAAPVRRATDLADLPGVWAAARAYLSTKARFLESVLGPVARLKALTLDPPQATLAVPNSHERYTNDRDQARLEESLRAVSGQPLKLSIELVDPPEAPIGITPAGSANTMASQRVPPELMEAVKKQPVVVELMKRLDAVVTSVEMIQDHDRAGE